MKKNLLTVLAVAAALLLSGCRNCHQPHFKIVELRSAGKELPNPNIDPSHCKPEGAEATLRSIRYVPDKPIYYMDYTAKVDWESILTDETHQTQLFDFLGTTKKVNEALFDETYQIGQVEYPGAACSGFICYNSKGEMLNCRNYDGDEGEMVVVFNHNVKPGEHKSVMMTDLNAAQMTSGTLDYGGYEVLLRDGIDVNVLLRQPVFLIDGMNDAGLVLTCYQLPDFQDEEEALQCLQYGNFGIEVPGQVTNWSCVYNSKQKTILFNVRDELDKAFTIDLKKDL